MNEFMAWLGEEEKRTSTQFSRKASPVVSTKKNGIQEKCHRFYCHRSGTYRPSGKGIRHLKAQGSSKIGFYCTAAITVVEKEQLVTATYDKTHHGHNRLLGHLRLTQTERSTIAKQLAEGVPKKDLLQGIRRGAGSDIKRLHLVSRKDLNNIATAYGVPQAMGDLHDYSAVLRSEKSKRSGKNKMKCKKVVNKIAVVGSGDASESWAMLFASVGYPVELYAFDPSELKASLERIRLLLQQHEANGSLRGKLSSQQQMDLISGAISLNDCVADAFYVQECLADDIETKKNFFQSIDGLIPSNSILCSSSGCFPGSLVASELVHKDRLIVCHAVNPHYYVSLVELVPTPWTDLGVVEKTRALMLEIGKKPVTIRKEVIGFAFSRIQYNILNTCWRLVEDGIISVEDVETVVSEGLGSSFAFMGALQTAYLNADGLVDFCYKNSKQINLLSDTFRDTPEMDLRLAEAMQNDLLKIVPFQNLVDHRAWRDSNLIALAKVKRVE